MLNENEGSPVSSKESGKSDFGRDVVLDIDLSRHGKKAEFNSRRIENFEETAEIAKSKDVSGYDIVAIRTSPAERAVDTALATKKGLEENKSYKGGTVNVRVRNLPTGVQSKGGVNIEEIMAESDQGNDINLMSAHIRELYRQAVISSPGSTWDKENAGVEVFVDHLKSNLSSLKNVIDELKHSDSLSDVAKKEVEDFKTAQQQEGGMSVLEIILRMTKHLQNYTKATNKFKNGTKIYIPEVNHSGFIEPFLLYLLDQQILGNPVDENGKSDLEKIGGGFAPNESVGISIHRKEKDGQVDIGFKLRNKEYRLDLNNELPNIFTRSEKLLSLIKSDEK